MAVSAFVANSSPTAVEVPELAELKAVADRCLHLFLDVATALLTIREQRPYRPPHPTFEVYVNQRFGLAQPTGECAGWTIRGNEVLSE